MSDRPEERRADRERHRELAIDTMASWALDGLVSDEQTLSYIREFVESDMTIEEAIERAKARTISHAQESDEPAVSRIMSGEPGLFPEIVDDLRKVLGAKLVAYIAGVSETRTVREWAEGSHKPAPTTEERLRLAHRIVTLIGQSEGEAVVPTWFQGMNPHLADRSPASVLHEDEFDEAAPRVLSAATAFVGA